MSSNRVLIIGYVWPEPNSSAAGTHMMEFIQLFLERGWQVHFASAAAETEHMANLPEMGVPVKQLEINDSGFDLYISELQPDIVMFDRFFIEEQFGWRVEKHCLNALRLLDTEDLHSLRNARHAAYKQNRQVSKTDLMSEMAQREVASIYRSDLSLMISDAEMTLLETEFNVPTTLLQHCPFMLDVDSLSADNLPDFGQRQHFVSIGNFRHAPNWDAVLYLKQIIWPLIHKQLPNAELHIYGAYPPPKATALHNTKEGFLVKGWAPDAFEVLRQGKVNLAPLRFGAGIKGKLADGMLCGIPSVTTSVGAEAMTANLPWGGDISDDPQEFASTAIQLYQSAESWQKAQQQGFAIAQKLFDKKRIGEALIKRIEELKDNLQEHRLNNFTGAMLRHHNHRSTQFMGQWIEAKNKLSALQNADKTM